MMISVEDFRVFIEEESEKHKGVVVITSGDNETQRR